jgi:putative FmdB family regulatory protein
MPMFEYKCEKCDKVFEELVFGPGDDMKCPTCGEHAEKQLSRCRVKMGGFGPGFADMPDAGGMGGGKCSGCSGGDCSTC